MNDGVVVNALLTIPMHEIQLSTSRAGGPGGQHVNTTDTRVELRWAVGESAALNEGQRARIQQVLASRINRNGELVLSCDTRRSQHQNRQEVLRRLAEILRRALKRRRRRIPTSPSPAARERRLQQKKRRAQIKRIRQRPDGES